MDIGAAGVAAFPAGGSVAIVEADTRGRKAPAAVDELNDGEAALLVLRALGAATDWRVGKAVRSVRLSCWSWDRSRWEVDVPFFGVGFPISLVGRWMPALKHFIG